MRVLARAAVLGALAMAGCGPDSAPGPEPRDQAAAQEAAPTEAAPTRAGEAVGIPPLQVVHRTYLARPDDQDWVEEIVLEEAGSQFLLYVEPQLRSPAEGPWTLTLAREGDARFIRAPNLHVDRATGRLTFLLQTQGMPPGDYLALLTLEEGGRATGPVEQGFRFRLR